MAKETYSYGNRDLSYLGAYVEGSSFGLYVYGKRDLCIWQKRPIHMAKTTYLGAYVEGSSFGL